MVRSRWMRWGAVSAVAAVALTGCVGDQVPTPSTSASQHAPSASQSLEATIDDALSVYATYMEAMPGFYASDSPNYTTLLEWATDEVATNEAASAADLAANGLALEGVPTVLAAIVAPDTVPTETTLEIGICSDLSSTRFVDGDGNDVTPSDRPNPAQLALAFERESADRPWRIASMGPWTSDQQPCA